MIWKRINFIWKLKEDDLTDISLDAKYRCYISTKSELLYCTGVVKEKIPLRRSESAEVSDRKTDFYNVYEGPEGDKESLKDRQRSFGSGRTGSPQKRGTRFLSDRKLSFPIKQKRSAGCALARSGNFAAKATALGARVPQAGLFVSNETGQSPGPARQAAAGKILIFIKKSLN